MQDKAVYPLLFTPVLKDYIWGGRNFETKLGRTLPPTGIIAESWEIAGHKDGTTAVFNGPLAGTPLTQLLTDYGLDLIGTRNQWALARDKFPLLIKLLDAQQTLSVQVHPDDSYALAHEGNELGKTEMWVVLDATADAQVILGVAPNTTPASFRQALEAGQLESQLHYLPVKTGDHICVPAGSLHAIMGGLLIAEVQQNSNTTYRVYDWNRTDADGQPRPLHIEPALATINFQQVAPTLCPPTPLDDQREMLCQNDYFCVERVHLTADKPFVGATTGETLEIWGVLQGGITVAGVAVAAVNFLLLPASLGAFVVQVTGGDNTAVCLRIYTPEK